MKDGDTVSAAVEAILTPHITSEQKFVFVRERDFYESCKLTSMTKRRFSEEVQDMMTGSKFCSKFGEWLYTEYGDGYHVFVRVTHPGTSHPGSTVRLLAELGVASIHDFE